jgi:dienelactone hydrolase
MRELRITRDNDQGTLSFEPARRGTTRHDSFFWLEQPWVRAVIESGPRLREHYLWPDGTLGSDALTLERSAQAALRHLGTSQPCRLSATITQMPDDLSRRPLVTTALMRVRTAIAVGMLAFAVTGCVASHRVAVTLPEPATLTAELYVPKGPGPFPALVLLHGCSGIGPVIVAWAQWLRAEGYAALVLDSFGGRGIHRLCGDSSPLRGQQRSPDVYAAAAYLATLPMIDRNRIGAMGWSHGGWTVLWAGSTEGRYPDVKLRALIAFYPACSDIVAYGGDTPLLMLLGELDDWTPPETCRIVALGARGAGRDVVDVLYPGAHHGFDAAHLPRPIRIADARGGRGATVAFNPSAHADAERRVREFLARYLRPN